MRTVRMIRQNAKGTKDCREPENKEIAADTVSAMLVHRTATCTFRPKNVTVLGGTASAAVHINSEI
jgi:hypothetical protein